MLDEGKQSIGRITGSSAEEPKSSLEEELKGEIAMVPSWQKVLDGLCLQ